MPRPEVVPTTLTDDDSAELTLTTTPSGITARIDGDTECTTPCKLRLAFGKHTIHLDHAGKRVDRDLRVLEDTTLHIALED
jgi:hypothetical protein